MIQFKVTHTVRCWCTCSVVHAGVYAGVALQFGGELQLQLMEVLLPDGVLHVRCELDLLCQAQNLKTESLHSHFRWTAETHGCFWRDVLGVCVCYLSREARGIHVSFLSSIHTLTQKMFQSVFHLRGESAQPNLTNPQN